MRLPMRVVVLPGRFDVPPHLPTERIAVLEVPLGTQPVQELDLDVLPVEYTVEIEHVGLEHGAGAVEDRAAAQVG